MGSGCERGFGVNKRAVIECMILLMGGVDLVSPPPICEALDRGIYDGAAIVYGIWFKAVPPAVSGQLLRTG